MKKIAVKIREKIIEYARIPSLTRNEGKFLKYLEADLVKAYGKKGGLYDIIPQGDGLEVRSRNGSKITILVHVDRIDVGSMVYYFGNLIATGQMDNVVSVAIARYLMYLGLNFNFLFTTKEEICQNEDQIVRYHERYPDNLLVDLDIDVTVKDEEVPSGCISIRRKDNAADYNSLLIDRLEGLAKQHSIPFINKLGDWLVVQIGLAMREDHTINGCYLGLPIDNYHSANEAVSVACVNNMVDFLIVLNNNQNRIIMTEEEGVGNNG